MPRFGTAHNNSFEKNTQLMATWPDIFRKERKEQEEKENIQQIKKKLISAEEEARLIQERNSRIQAAYLQK
jgi:hypothetical protein